jgi:KipI family sensor histidine kinase inhibitor
MRIFPLGDSAATIEFGNELTTELNDRVLALVRDFSSNPFDGLSETVAAYASVTVFYDHRIIQFKAVKLELEKRAASIGKAESAAPRIVKIPIIISDESSPDLARVAEHAGLDTDQVLEIFLSESYRVYMLGFLPGFAYMGEVDERIAAPRLETPRTSVAKGSVGIAGKQTGIYPLQSPGGWNIIGRTELEMFDPTSDQPCTLKPGDEVRFVRC